MITATGVDLAPLLQTLIQLIAGVVVSVGVYFIQGHIKDDNARRTVLTAVENGVSFGMNKVNGALAGHPLNVPLGSSVAAQAVKYALSQVPDALDRLGIDEAKLAKMAIAKLPAVEGHISDDQISEIAAVAQGQAPAARTNPADLALALEPLLARLIEVQLAKRAAAAPPAA